MGPSRTKTKVKYLYKMTVKYLCISITSDISSFRKCVFKNGTDHSFDFKNKANPKKCRFYYFLKSNLNLF